MRPCRLIGQDRGSQNLSMRRPRFGLVSRSPGVPAPPPAGTKTGCPQEGLHAAELKERRGPLRTRAPPGVRSARKRGSGVRNRRTWSAGRRLVPIARDGGTPRKRLIGWLRQPPRERSQAPASAGAPLPLLGSREVECDEGSPGADTKNTGDGARPLVIPGR